ncbi:4-hydroxy-tetrahydrodipicolinate synthase [Alkalihalobacillus sp. FSL W8-0930]
MDFGQIVTAMVTPFNDKGELDLGASAELIDHLIATGTESLVVAGTTGESPTLTTNEKLKLFEFVIGYTNKRIPVILGTGTNDTASSIELSKHAERLGADAIMAVVPYYNRPNQAGMIAHFSELAANTSLPIMLYNVPHRTGAHMLDTTAITLSKIENIVSIKEASGDLEQMASIIDGTHASFTVYSGDDSLTLPALSIGANGVVSVASHVIGNELKEMVHAFTSGDTKRAAALHLKLLPQMKALFLTPNPVCVKHRLSQIGVHTGETRLPLVPLTSEEQAKVDSFFK